MALMGMKSPQPQRPKPSSGGRGQKYPPVTRQTFGGAAPPNVKRTPPVSARPGGSAPPLEKPVIAGGIGPRPGGAASGPRYPITKGGFAGKK